MSTNKPLTDRFWEKVNKDGPIPDHRPDLGPCWVWTASTFSNGYGRFNYTGDTRALGAHRGAWILFVGPVPDGMKVLHHCDNPPCVNYERHLFLGTGADNSRDMVAKGRAARNSGQAKLTEGDVREIRRIYAEGGTSFARVARRFGVTTMAAYYIVHRITWAHVA